MKVTDKTVLKCLGFCGNGMGSNVGAVDVLDGKVVRIRPLHYDTAYTKEELKSWKIEKDGHVFEPGFKSLIPPFSVGYKRRTYSPNRVPYPLKRVDWDPNGERNPQNRGISKYERISWDEATTIVANEIKRIHDAYGPYSIYCQGDGHGETKVYSGAHGCMSEMLDMVDGCTKQARNPDSWEGWYWGAKHMWGMEPMGMNRYQNGVLRDVTENTDAILYWGADPETTPWGWDGQQASRMCFWFNEIGIKSIFVCPDVNYACAVHADKWIPVLPNTDAAMQLAIAYVWLTEGTYDKDYIATHAIGFDWFEWYVMGGEDGVKKTPEWASEKCGVPAYTIRALARYWAKHAVSIAHGDGGGYIRAAFSHEPARLEIALLGMQGLGKPGCNQFKFIEWNLFGIDTFCPLPRAEIYPTIEGAYHGWKHNTGPSFIPKTLIPKAILEPPITWYGHAVCTMPTADQFQKFEFPQPGNEGIRMIWSDCPCWSTCWNGGNEFEEALRSEKIDFVGVQHPWMENDTLFADIILPAATMMECEDIATENMNGQFALLYHEERAVDYVGEALPDFLIEVEIAKKLEKFGGVYENLVEKMTEGMDAEGWIRQGFEQSGVPEDFTYDQFIEQKFWASPIRDGWETEPAGLIQFYEDPEKFPLSTPTGKLEYYSTALAEQFPDDKIRAPYPQWIEKGDGHDDRITSERAKDYPFLLVTNHPRWRVHANHDDIPWLREIETCKVEGPDGYWYEPLWLNPKDAEKLGLKDGDVAEIFNERGTVLGGVRVTERIMPGAVYQDHGTHIDSIVAGRGGLERSGANNLIAPSPTTSKNCAGEVTNSYLVGVRKADVFKLAEQYPEQFGRDYIPSVGLIASAYLAEEGE